ncbi:MAG TPA: DNA-3-methyladenine glycosylase 2 family protein [Chromatiales bacterium]|nr:DNA-3-methyladenine glycosylase 2 family protein [Thiotrichales bacterium]HIP69390.1 DNA-3-methyladenine glycosylase 2 family protein [Chromatiales bacterium]
MSVNKKLLVEAENFLRQCRYLGPVVEEHGACEIDLSGRDPFDTLISSIIAQQLSVKAANTIESRVRKVAGKKYKSNKLLSIPHQTLRECGLSNRKAEYILGIAQAVNDKFLDFNTLAELDDRDVIQQLVKLRGVGQWTAEMLMIFSLGRTDIFSSQDIGLQRGMKSLFGKKASSLPAMEKLAERWRPYRSVASWYLWKIVD